MASGTLGAENSREKHRWGEGNKVYTRKINKGRKNTSTTITTTTTNTTGNNNDNHRNNDDNAAICAATTTADDSNKNDNNVPEQSSQTLATEDRNLSQQQQQARSEFDAAPDNSSSHNRPPHVATPNGREGPGGNGVVNGALKPVITRVDDRVRINLAAARSKSEIRELRRKLVSELDQVRSLVKKLEAKEIQLTRYNTATIGGGGCGSYGNSHVLINDVMERSALVRENSEMLSVGHKDARQFRPPSVSVSESNLNHGVCEFVEKEKRTPKANLYYQNSDFLLAKDRLPHPESNKKLKSNGGKKHGRHMVYGFGADRYRSQVWKSCSNLLQRLMKHKHGWVFNEPVNAKALGLHDYHDIIKRPMDLGTIKSRLEQKYYKSPGEFAEDVRLTFRNAMTYNPKGQDVHIMAEQLSEMFEERWAVIDSEYNPDWRYAGYHEAGLPGPTPRKVPPPAPPPPSATQMRALDRSESMTATVDSTLKPTNFATVGRTPVPKKPKAKDPNKRDMTYEEKQRLSTNLQSLPSEKLDNIVQIIKKRNSALCQHDDEIEVDIDSVDAETLWELDRFVTNYKKSLSKNKRKAEIAQARAEAGHAVSAANSTPAVVEAPKERKTDNKNATTVPVQGEKQGDNASRSSSSSSSSSDSGSSSSDSDSDSSSGYGSDVRQSL